VYEAEVNEIIGDREMNKEKIIKGGDKIMKRIVETAEESGFEAMLGEKISVWCGIYIYTGQLTGVNEDQIELTNAYIIYETGDLASGPWKDAQSLPGIWRIMKRGIESWGKAKC